MSSNAIEEMDKVSTALISLAYFGMEDGESAKFPKVCDNESKDRRMFIHSFLCQGATVVKIPSSEPIIKLNRQLSGMQVPVFTSDLPVRLVGLITRIESEVCETV